MTKEKNKKQVFYKKQVFNKKLVFNKKQVFMRLLKYVFKYKFLFLSVILLTIVANIIGLIGPYFSGLAINLIDVDESLVIDIDINKVLFYVLIMLIIYIISSFLSYIIQILMVITSQKITHNMRKDVFHKLMKLPIKYFDDTKIGDIVSRMSYDIDVINTSLSSDIVHVFSSIITVCGSFIIMLTISPILILVFIITLPISFFLTKQRTKIVRPLFRMRSKKNGQMNGFIEEITSGHKTIKVYNSEEAVIEKFKEINDDVTNTTYLAEYHGFIMGPLMGFISNISLTLISVVGSILYLFSKIKLGDISNFIQYSRRFSGPINEFANIMADIQSALSASERIFTLLDEKNEPDDKIDAKILEKAIGSIKFENVDFGYLENKLIIENLNLDVKPGQLIAIVGPTGAGKTTIVNLLMRFYDVNSGKIYLDGIDIKDITRDSLRSQYAMVLQDTWLFNGTIYENLAYGNKSATLEDVKKACEKANIAKYIEKLDDGYNSIIDDSGNHLSKGQKQLLTIARAMLLNSNLLILDEATSNVDTITELEIEEAMINLMKNKTCFVIAHRLSTIKNADKILVINEGKIVEQGTHSELLGENGFYAKLYNAQFN